MNGRARVAEAPAVRSLVELACAGDTAAFESLVRGRTDAMYRLSLAILGNETDAADALQDSLIGAWRHVRDLREADRFEAWLERIVVNTCRMSLRARSRRRVREIPLEVLESAVAPGGGRGDAALLRAVIQRLSPEQRAILALHYFEDRPLAEIAKVMAIPVGTAKSRLFNARAALLRAIGEEGRQ
jgi:RNA polymerase sigma factor (sigma-70 family)